MQDVYCWKLLHQACGRERKEKERSEIWQRKPSCDVESVDALADTTGNSEDILTEAE